MGGDEIEPVARETQHDEVEGDSDRDLVGALVDNDQPVQETARGTHGHGSEEAEQHRPVTPVVGRPSEEWGEVVTAFVVPAAEPRVADVRGRAAGPVQVPQGARIR